MVTDSRAGRCSGAEQEHSLLKAKVIISTIEPGHHTIRLIRDGGEGGGGVGGMEVGGKGDHIPIATLSHHRSSRTV